MMRDASPTWSTWRTLSKRHNRRRRPCSMDDPRTSRAVRVRLASGQVVALTDDNTHRWPRDLARLYFEWRGELPSRYITLSDLVLLRRNRPAGFREACTGPMATWTAGDHESVYRGIRIMELALEERGHAFRSRKDRWKNARRALFLAMQLAGAVPDNAESFEDLSSTELGHALWTLAALYAANGVRSPFFKSDERTPEQRWREREVRIRHLRETRARNELAGGIIRSDADDHDPYACVAAEGPARRM